jgi:hypothetical protein
MLQKQWPFKGGGISFLNRLQNPERSFDFDLASNEKSVNLSFAPLRFVLLCYVLLRIIILGFVILGFVLLGIVLLGIALLCIVILGFVLLGFVIHGIVILSICPTRFCPTPHCPTPQRFDHQLIYKVGKNSVEQFEFGVKTSRQTCDAAVFFTFLNPVKIEIKKP